MSVLVAKVGSMPLRRFLSAACAMLIATAPLTEAWARKGGGDSNSGRNSADGKTSGTDRKQTKESGAKATSGAKKQAKKRNSDDADQAGSSSSRTTKSQRTQPKPPMDTPPPKPPKERPPKPPRDQPNKPPKGKKPPSIPLNQFPGRPQPPQRPPVTQLPPRLTIPTPPVFVAPPATTFVPATIVALPPLFLPPPPPQRALPPRRTPSTVPPPADVNRSRDREILIAVEDSVSDGDTITLGLGLALNVEVQYRSSLLGLKIVRLRIPDTRAAAQVIEQAIQAGVTDPRIVAVQPNYVFESTQMVATKATQPVPQYSTEKVRLTGAHLVSLGRNIRVAVIDTGLDSAHPELTGAIADSFDAIGEGLPEAEAHGTAIAGIVAARQQIKGMAPDARVLAVRAFASTSGGKPAATTLALIKGLDWAAANNARIVNMSFAGPRDPLLQEAIEQAEARGLIMVAAAGNGGPDAASAYPAAYDRVIAVTASDSDDQLYDKANRGTYVAIAAPGVDILAPAPKESYEMSSGTSLAAAHVSGIIALILERNPSLTTQDVRTILARTARDPDRSATARGLGAGIVDAAKAVAAAK
jgi:Subtilase family